MKTRSVRKNYRRSIRKRYGKTLARNVLRNQRKLRGLKKRMSWLNKLN